METSFVLPDMKSRASSNKKPSKKLPIVLIALGLMLVTLFTMLVLCLVPGIGKNSRNPKLVIYQEKANVPNLSLENTLHAVGFEYSFLEYGQELPVGSNNVVVGVGSKALSVVDRFKDDPNVSGFILICPELTEEYMSDLSGVYPALDIAIFEGRDEAKTPIDMSDGRIIYERLSGDDTLYGTPIKRGTLFASTVFVNNAQNRTLSLSCFDINDPTKIWFSPLFQNELAGYLSVTYLDILTRDASFGRINAWFILGFISVMLGVVSILWQLSGFMLSATGEDKKKAPVSKLVVALIGGISIATTIGIIASTSSLMLKNYMPYILTMMPVVFMGCLFVINFKWIYNREVEFNPKRNDTTRALTLAFVIGLFLMFITILYSDLRVVKITDTAISSALLLAMFVFDTTFASGLIYASRKSSFAGQGAKNCFGNRLIFAMMFIPSLASLIYSFVPGETGSLYNGLSGLLVLSIPYFAVKPLIRHTERSLIPGILHGFVYTLVLAVLL